MDRLLAGGRVDALDRKTVQMWVNAKHLKALILALALSGYPEPDAVSWRTQSGEQPKNLV